MTFSAPPAPTITLSTAAPARTRTPSARSAASSPAVTVLKPPSGYLPAGT